jgi:hypothetical protein
MFKIPLLEKLSLRVNFQVRELNSRVCNWILRVKKQTIQSQRTTSYYPYEIFMKN